MITPQKTPLNHHKLPVGEIRSEEPVKGDFLCIPLFGWISVRQKTGTPLVMLSVLLIRSLEEPVPQGTLNIELPVLNDTEMATVRCLERFGWDGRVWPIDEGWPEGSVDDEKQLIALMDQGNIRATLTFPPGEQGIQAQPVSVQRAKGPFLMPPLEDDGIEPQESNVEKLRQLCGNPKQFHRPVKPAVLTIESDPEGTRKLVQRMMGTKTKHIVRSLKSACQRERVEVMGLSKRKDVLAKLVWWSFKDSPEVKKKFVEAAATLKAEPEKLMVEGLVVAAEVLEAKVLAQSAQDA